MCNGEIFATDADNGEIDWSCSHCDEEGIISEWEGTLWDLTGLPPPEIGNSLGGWDKTDVGCVPSRDGGEARKLPHGKSAPHSTADIHVQICAVMLAR